ncbi:EamA family transporter [Salinisphaera aquimarina]|uniref:EamA family transporter n=1 Tax=Salinisphaera aquimarina TaxID=2094031 RepID=A0ABV7ENH8_9GAMM
MICLVAVTLLWAFSYSLIGVYLSGTVDSYFAVLTRITLASLLFLPVLRWRGLAPRWIAALMAVGAVELGLMYTFFYQSFLWLSVPEVLLFTIFTPIYVTLIEDLLQARFNPIYLLTALGAVAGAAVIRYDGVGHGIWTGFAIVQGANLCFAAGQVAYRHVAPHLPDDVPSWRVFGWFFLGAWPLAAALFLWRGDWQALPSTTQQWGVLLWLGLAASGAGYFLWNRGATQVDAGALAIMNNALIPAGLLVNLLIWNRDADVVRLALGAVIIVTVLVINERWARQSR